MEPEPDWYLGEWTCKLCQRKDDPGSTVRVRCAESGVDLCVKCLISGAEAEGVARKKGDAYYVALWPRSEIVAILAGHGLDLHWSHSFAGRDGRWLTALFRKGARA